MLPPFIIDQIRRREIEPQEDDRRPFLELPLPDRSRNARPRDEPDEPQRGVLIIDL